MSNPWYTPLQPGTSSSYKWMEHTPSNSREMRNKAEKMRRDKINAFIGELATLVPMIAKSAKRMDKTSILRLTATHLRIYQTLLNSRNRPHVELPKQVNQYVLEQIVCEQLGGFLLIVTTAGKIVFVSPTVENLLGYLQTDLMGQTLYNIASPNDHDKVRTYLLSEGDIDSTWKKYFNVRLKRAGPRSEVPVYETVKVMGMHRPYKDANRNSPTSSEVSTTSVVNNDILVLFVRICRPEPISSRLLEASKDEYVTRHLIDGRIINCDHRIAIIAGYMTDEVSGLSAFKFMHRDDVRWVMIALRQMYDRGETKGSSCYRLLGSNGKFIYLRTFGFLEIDDQGTVESFICVNTLVGESEGLHLIDEMKKRFAAIVNSSYMPLSRPTSRPPSLQSIEAVEDPQEVEHAVIQLIRNLPSPAVSDNRSTPSPKFYCKSDKTKDCRRPSSSPSLTEPRSSSPKKYKTPPTPPPETAAKTAAILKRSSDSSLSDDVSCQVLSYKRHKMETASSTTTLPKRSPVTNSSPYQILPSPESVHSPQSESSILFRDQLLTNKI